MTKPFKLGELCSRIRALLRRAGVAKPVPPEMIQRGDTRIDLLGSRAYLDEVGRASSRERVVMPV